MYLLSFFLFALSLLAVWGVVLPVIRAIYQSYCAICFGWGMFKVTYPAKRHQGRYPAVLLPMLDWLLKLDKVQYNLMYGEAPRERVHIMKAEACTFTGEWNIALRRYTHMHLHGVKQLGWGLKQQREHAYENCSLGKAIFAGNASALEDFGQYVRTHTYDITHSLADCWKELLPHMTSMLVEPKWLAENKVVMMRIVYQGHAKPGCSAGTYEAVYHNMFEEVPWMFPLYDPIAPAKDGLGVIKVDCAMCGNLDITADMQRLCGPAANFGAGTKFALTYPTLMFSLCSEHPDYSPAHTIEFEDTDMQQYTW